MVDLSKRSQGATTNPFESPEHGGLDARAQPAAGVLDPVLAMKQGFEALMRNIVPWLLVAFVGSAISLLVTFTVIGIFVVIPVIMWGYVKFLLNTVDGQADFGDLFAGFSRYGEALGGMLGFGVVYVLISIPGSAISWGNTAMEVGGGGSAVLALLGFAVSFVWFFAVTCRILFAPFYMVDQGLGPIEGLKASWEATKTNWMPTALFWVLSFVVLLAGFIALIVGVIPATMITYSAMAAAYRQISSR